MATRAKKVLAGIAALAALAFGAATIAQAGGGSQGEQTPPSEAETVEQESVAPENSTGDPENIQYEDESDEGEKAEAPEGSEASEGDEGPEGNEAQEGREAGEEEGGEVTGDDGPNGHADEPANPNADHQFEGKE